IFQLEKMYLHTQVICLDDRSFQRFIFISVQCLITESSNLVKSPAVKYLNAHTGVVLIRSRKKHYQLIWSALSFITCLENRGQKVQCFLSCLPVGGKRGSKFLVKYNRQQLHRMLLDCRTDAEKQEVRRAILSCSLSNVREEEADEDGSDDDGDEETQNPS
uniref:POP5 homolog, ribonuclease P/MRP subunit n=1 Tax=Sinocyclocheilus anshuiensis TaxID=1608454 RepID=A0A671Q9Q4_9TELE